jgi:hypothetical protein
MASSRALGEAADAVLEDRLPLVGGEPAHGLGRLCSQADGPVDDVAVGQGHASRHLARVLVDDGQVGVGEHRLIGEIIRVALPQHAGTLVASAAKRKGAPRA